MTSKIEFLFVLIFLTYFYFLSNSLSRASRKSVVPDSINLSTKRKRRNWKVVVEPEFNDDDDDEEELRKEVEYEKLPFDGEQVYNLISETVQKIFVVEDEEGESKAFVYNPADNVNVCQRISKEVRDVLKTWRHLQRYRIVVLTTVAEKHHQGITYRMKYLVDPKTDNFVKFYLDNPNFYIIVFVMLIYQD